MVVVVGRCWGKDDGGIGCDGGHCGLVVVEVVVLIVVVVEATTKKTTRPQSKFHRFLQYHH